MLNSSKMTRLVSGGAATSANATTQFADLTAIPVGTGNNARTGTEVKLKELDIKFVCALADTYNFVRFILFEWIPSDSSDGPGASEIFNTNFSSGNNDFFCGINQLRPSRFRILHDQTCDLHAANVIESHHIKMKLGWTCNFDTGSTTGRNHLYLAYISDSTAVTHPAFSYSYSVVYNE